MSKAKYDEEEPDFSKPRRSLRSKSIAFVVAVAIVGLIFGLIGGVGGIILLSTDNGELAKKLGLTDGSSLSIPTTKTEKLILEESSAITDSVNKVSPAVVSIQLKKTVQDIFGQVYTQEGGGTGFIITNDGLILTNKHVVVDQNATYTVILADGRAFDAKVSSLDPIQDLAVIKIDANNLPVVDLGDSDQIKVGQWVVAIGNALGRYENSVTAGVISARNRSVEASDSSGQNTETLDNLFQTDTAINSGNSGGPLINLAGQVIGINTAVASNAQNIGFAIPINTAKSAIDSIKKTGRIIRPYLGVRFIAITKDIADQNKLNYDYGALIVKGGGLGNPAVVSGSPADKAGLQENDIVLEVNGEKVDQNNSLVKLVQQYNVGDTIDLKISSKGSEKTVKVKLEESK